jgi:hypothetical protein
MIRHEGIVFGLHSFKPTRVLHSLVVCARLSRKCDGSEGQKEIFGGGVQLIIRKEFGTEGVCLSFSKHAKRRGSECRRDVRGRGKCYRG